MRAGRLTDTILKTCTEPWECGRRWMPGSTTLWRQLWYSWWTRRNWTWRTTHPGIVCQTWHARWLGLASQMSQRHGMHTGSQVWLISLYWLHYEHDLLIQQCKFILMFYCRIQSEMDSQICSSNYNTANPVLIEIYSRGADSISKTCY